MHSSKPNYRKILLLLLIFGVFLGFLVFSNQKNNNLPVIAIANYGSHSSLNDISKGVREGLENHGFIDGKNIQIIEQNVNFQTLLIPQMLTNLKHLKPKVMVVLSTPVALSAKNIIKDIPVVYGAVTDPLEVGLIEEKGKPYNNFTGISEKQNLEEIFKFAQTLVPNAKRVGILTSSAEINDFILLKMAKEASKKLGIELVSVSVEQSQEIPLKMQLFKNKVDFIYVGGSGLIQPSLPAIVLEAEKMKIPVINLNAQEVKEHKVLASYGVSYHKLGVSIAAMVKEILQGVEVSEISPQNPSITAYEGAVSLKRAKAIQLPVPADLKNILVIE